MLNREEELGLLEILKSNFPPLNGRGLVISINQFLSADINLQNFMYENKNVQEAAIHYINEKIPYLILDESEGYKCIFLKGNYLKVQYDVSSAKVIRYVEESE